MIALPVAPKCWNPARYILTFLGFLGFVNIYSLRVNLSVALVAMVNTTEDPLENKTVSACVAEMELEDNMDKDLPGRYMGIQYEWNSKMQGHILGSFYYGYVITQLPGGVVAEKHGAKWLFGGGIFLTAVLTLLTPVVAGLGTGAFITLRVIEGLGEGVTFPAMNCLISRWSPKFERSRVSTIIYTGALMGNVITMPIAGYLCSTNFLGGWPSVFYVFGVIACIWFVFWSFLIFDSPADHPRITDEELVYILSHQGDSLLEDTPKDSPPIPWKAIFTSLPVWAVIVAHFGHSFGFLIFLTELPTFMGSVLQFDIKSNGGLSALPYIVQAISAWTAAYIADRLRQSQRLRVTAIRKLFNTIGFLGPAFCLLGVTAAGCRPRLIVGLITLAMAINGIDYSGYNVTHVDMSPDFAGTLYGITNTLSNLCGILGPAMVGYFTRDEVDQEHWNSVFYITSAVYIITAVFYLAFCSAEVQPWGEASRVAMSVMSNEAGSESVSKPNSDSDETKHGLNNSASAKVSKSNTDSIQIQT